MTDNTDFSITLGLFINNNTNLDSYHHCLASVFYQKVPFTKVCLLDGRQKVDKPNLIMNDFLTQGKAKLGFNPHYIRCTPNLTLFEFYKRGFNFVSEPCTPQTPLFMMLESNRFLPANFLSKVKTAFEKHRYTINYRWQELPENGAKILNNISFLAASQVIDAIFNKFVVRDDSKVVYTMNDIIGDEWLKPEAPWVKETTIDTTVEVLP